MMGLFVLGLLIFWTSLSFWLGSIISKKFFPLKEGSEKNDYSGIARYRLIRVLITVFLFCLPILDQIIAYPKWQQLCATTGDFEWGPGMDEGKAFGREVITVSKRVTTESIFPNIKLDYRSWYIYDAKTNDLIFMKPHYSYSSKAFFSVPSSSGDAITIILPECSNHSFRYKTDDIFEKLNLTVSEQRKVLK